MLNILRAIKEDFGKGPDNMQPFQQEGYITVPYSFKRYNVVDKIARKENKKLMFQRGPTIFNILRNEKDPRKDKEKNGVYKIPVIELENHHQTLYIGMMTQTLAKRLEEHKRGIAREK